jgi:hypothetical protein
MACRNEIMGARMYAIDLRFSQFEEELFRDTRRGGFNTTLATLGLTTAAAASSGGASQVLSGLGALVIGGREAFQKEVLAERTVIAIHGAMRTRRAQVALKLRAGMATPIEGYPVTLGLADLSEYFSAGTVLGALINVTEAVGVAAQTAEDNLRKFSLDAGATKLRLSVCGTDASCKTPNMDALTKAKACWAEAGVPADTLMIDFVMKPDFASQRLLVTKCMGL